MLSGKPATFAVSVGKPHHGTDFTPTGGWAWRRGMLLDFVRRGKPVENSLIESFNGRLRYDCLNVNELASIESEFPGPPPSPAISIPPFDPVAGKPANLTFLSQGYKQ